ncbi:MAG: RloB domain-containing protein [Candidatus Cloacimonetes bacterium]|nr:RloB domain-containing protein [Candidatus Cloacimonadota bacterium]
MAKRKNKIRDLKSSTLILCEGESEKQYIIRLKSREREALRYLKIDPQPYIPQGDAISILNKAIEEAEYRKNVYCLIDLDQVHTQQKFDKYIIFKNKALMKSNILVIESYPCFETWVKFHYELITKEVCVCDSMKDEVLKHIVNYEKGDKGFDLYSHLKPLLPIAVTNAKSAENNRNKILELNTKEKDCRLPFSDIYQLIEALKIV